LPAFNNEPRNFQGAFPTLSVSTSCSSLHEESDQEISIEDFLAVDNFDEKLPPSSSFGQCEISPMTAVHNYFNFDSTYDYRFPSKFNFDRRSSVESVASDGTVVSDEFDDEEKKLEASLASSSYEGLESISETLEQKAEDVPSFMEELMKNVPCAAESSLSKTWVCFIPSCGKVYSTGAGLRYHMSHFHKCKIPIRVQPKQRKAKQTEWSCDTCSKKYTTHAGFRYHMKTIHKRIGGA